MSLSFESAYCSGTVEAQDYDRELVIRGIVNEYIKDDTLYYLAAAPPDYRATFSGSGLPFASQVQAFDNTPNRGSVRVPGYGSEFVINLMTPNAYYTGLGTVYVPPTLYIEYTSQQGIKRNLSVKVSNGIPYRSLTHPGPGQGVIARANAMFYATQFHLPVRSQEQILRDSAYPENNKMNKDFWGLKPPM